MGGRKNPRGWEKIRTVEGCHGANPHLTLGEDHGERQPLMSCSAKELMTLGAQEYYFGGQMTGLRGEQPCPADMVGTLGHWVAASVVGIWSFSHRKNTKTKSKRMHRLLHEEGCGTSLI